MTDPINLSRSLTAARMGIRLSTGKSFSISLGGVASVYVLEVEDLLFRHDSAVMLPEAYEGDIVVFVNKPGELGHMGLFGRNKNFIHAARYKLKNQSWRDIMKMPFYKSKIPVFRTYTGGN